MPTTSQLDAWLAARPEPRYAACKAQAPTVHLDSQGRVTSKKFGPAWVFWPLSCRTGALHQQPSTESLEVLACSTFTPDYDVHFDLRSAIDAPDMIPSGGVRAQDFEPAHKGRLLLAHIHREGRWS